MTKHRLAKIAASIAVAPFYGVAWCFGLVVRVVAALIDAIITGFTDALLGERDIVE